MSSRFARRGRSDNDDRTHQSQPNPLDPSGADHAIANEGFRRQPSRMLLMQRTVGNAALQRIMHSSSLAAPQTEGYDTACYCPMCKPERVYTDEPLAPSVQRASNAHDAGCTCPACSVSAQAQAVQRSSYEDEQAAGGSQQATQGQAGNASQNSAQNGNDADGGIMTVQEDFESEETDVLVDQGLHVAVVSGDENDVANVEEQANANAPATSSTLPGFSFQNAGMTGYAPIEITSRTPVDDLPHAFVDGGQTGTVVWAGGGGAGPRGNQGVGTIQTENQPTYVSQSNGVLSDSSAWVQAGTGDLTVTRSWLGAKAGDQGNGHYVTASAATRFNSHEILHVNSTSSIYNSTLKPMLDRVTPYRAKPDGSQSKVNAFFQSGAIAALRSAIDWGTAVSNFQTQDTAANAPMNTVDNNDLKSGTYPVDRGPGKIGGVDFQHRVTLPSEAAPT